MTGSCRSAPSAARPSARSEAVRHAARNRSIREVATSAKSQHPRNRSTQNPGLSVDKIAPPEAGEDAEYGAADEAGEVGGVGDDAAKADVADHQPDQHQDDDFAADLVA